MLPLLLVRVHLRLQLITTKLVIALLGAFVAPAARRASCRACASNPATRRAYPPQPAALADGALVCRRSLPSVGNLQLLTRRDG
ncbi:MAG: hypothetical protein JO063_13880 [Pseudonocardiales bacterium]|nr:hypothetical protein [Pseudonocardiales bacterium]